MTYSEIKMKINQKKNDTRTLSLKFAYRYIKIKYYELLKISF